MKMTHKYQNTGFNTGTSTFVEVDTSTPSEVKFANRAVKAQLAKGYTLPMVSGSVNLRVERENVPCGETCPMTYVESIGVNFNLARDGVNLAAMRAELLRLFDQAVADYGLMQGLVPPVYANFVGE